MTGKVEGPVTCLDFLGFELGYGAMEIRLPQRKLNELQEVLQEWSGTAAEKNWNLWPGN